MDPRQSPPSNPYAPPAASDTAWEPAPHSPDTPPLPTGAPKVFGVLSIVFGSIVLLGGLFGACGGLAGQSMTRMGRMGSSLRGREAEAVRAMMDQIGSIYTVIGAQSLVFSAMSGLLLAIGIGQLRYRRWACRWSVYWGYAALAVLAGVIVLSLTVVGPAYARMIETLAKHSPSGAIPAGFSSGMASIFGGTSAILMIVFYAPYPILMLLFFNRDRIRAAMNQ
ncbi:MAG: hypothetical protein IT371_16045 [Deltaproteobacteria bacterium]|nr:hypothetical protein [Deltaproteobacteria bacterium]